MEELEVISTGITVLDSLLGGGFLSNSIIVISHQAAINYWELVHRLIFNNFDQRFYLVLITFHLSLQEYIDRAKYSVYKPEIFKDITETVLTSGLSVIDCFNISDEKEDSEICDVRYVSNPFNVDNLLSVMSKVRNGVPRDKRVYWIFYNLTNMSIGVHEDELVKFCRKAFRYHKLHGDQAIYILNENAHTEKFFAKMYQLSDVFIKLFSEEISDVLENGIQVIKNVFPFRTKKIFFDINENMEIQFRENKLETKSERPANNYFPTSRNLEDIKDNQGNSKFFRTGIPRLDSLLGGGMLSNSIVITSYQYGVRALEPLHHIFKNKFNEKTHVVQINYHFSQQEYETRSKILEQKTEIHKAPVKSFSYGNTSIIDCFNITQSETEIQKSNIHHISNPFDVDKLLSVMTRIRNNIPEKRSVFWIFHSLTDMSIGIPEDELLKFCRRAFRYHKWCGDLAVYNLNDQAHSERFHAKLYQLSDVFIKFIAEDTKEGIDTSIQILKSPLNYDSTKTKYILDEKGQIQFS